VVMRLGGEFDLGSILCGHGDGCEHQSGEYEAASHGSRF
jgi:hypothetical protein